MTNEITDTGMPGDEVPICDPNHMTYVGDGTVESQIFRYHNRAHTERDVLRPGYFDTARDRGLRAWDELHYCVGGPNPSDASRGVLVIESMPGTRGVAADSPVIVGIVQRFGKATVVAHDGGADVKPKTAKAA